jgi:hypothetical protein
MSTAEPVEIEGSGVLEDFEPHLVQYDDEGNFVRRFQPLAAEALGGTLPWDTESTQLQCGETITSTTGDMNIRLRVRFICTKTQFETLIAMRNSPEQVDMVSDAYDGRATFDQLKFERVEDANDALGADVGRITEPIYDVQLQTKENDSETIGDFTDS